MCDSSWRTVIAATCGSATVRADDGGQALADRFVEAELAGLDELQHDDRRDHLADAGDAEAVAGLDRLGRRPAAVVGAGGRRRRWRAAEVVRDRRGDGGGGVGGGTRKPKSAVCTIRPSTAMATPTAWSPLPSSRIANAASNAAHRSAGVVVLVRGGGRRRRRRARHVRRGRCRRVRSGDVVVGVVLVGGDGRRTATVGGGSNGDATRGAAWSDAHAADRSGAARSPPRRATLLTAP